MNIFAEMLVAKYVYIVPTSYVILAGCPGRRATASSWARRWAFGDVIQSCHKVMKLSTPHGGTTPGPPVGSFGSPYFSWYGSTIRSCSDVISHLFHGKDMGGKFKWNPIEPLLLHGRELRSGCWRHDQPNGVASAANSNPNLHNDASKDQKSHSIHDFLGSNRHGNCFTGGHLAITLSTSSPRHYYPAS
jgi:hypothetical protein